MEDARRWSEIMKAGKKEHRTDTFEQTSFERFARNWYQDDWMKEEAMKKFREL